MKDANLQPSSLQYSSFLRKEGAKQAALILMKNSHFNRTPLYRMICPYPLAYPWYVFLTLLLTILSSSADHAPPLCPGTYGLQLSRVVSEPWQKLFSRKADESRVTWIKFDPTFMMSS